jgi:hypothetical protein
MLADNPFLISVPFGLSNSLNRVLYFGNPAPITKFKQGRILSSPIRNPLQGTDQSFLSSFSDVDLNFGNLDFTTPSGQYCSPEVHILWENGVFKENILNVRFSRPFTKNLTAHIYSNYRYFRDQIFSHNGSDVFNFFSSFQDSADLSFKGYSPLVDEHLTGAGFDWTKNKNKFSLSAQYGEYTNEIPLDTFDAQSLLSNKTINAKYFQYPFSLTGNAVLSHTEKVFSILEARILTEPLTRIAGATISGSLQPLRKDANLLTFDGAIKSGFQISKEDSAGILYTTFITRQTLYNDSLRDAYQHLPSVFYCKGFNLAGLSGNLTIDGGVILSSLRDSLFMDPRFNINVQLSSDKDNVPLVSPPDTLPQFAFINEGYLRAGCELFFNWNIFNLGLGYQYISQIDTQSIINAWPSQFIPYQQPQSSISIAPSFTPSENVTFSINTMISERKPYVKAFGKLMYTVHPFSTSEFIDASLYLNYWSERDPISFAGKTNWNKPVIHPGLEITAHIKTFRLFYKVDNLLNREFAYVPGYYSRGITFRWGFNWFIPR